MTALAKTYSFTAGKAIVAALVNENFDDDEEDLEKFYEN